MGRGQCDPIGDGARLDVRVSQAHLIRSLFGVTERVSIGPYDLLEQIGAGETGWVFKALDRRNDRTVALKVPRACGPQQVSALRREFALLHAVAHPNVIRAHEIWDAGSESCLSLELVEGCSFLRHVRPSGCLDEHRLRAALVQLIDALCVVHAAGVLHRDLKPAHLLVRTSGNVVLLDFGLARRFAETASENGSGTLFYVAPERRRGQTGAAASDWYSVGVVLWQALTGNLPRLDHTPLLRSGQASSLPDDLVHLCNRLLDAEPSLRPTGSMLKAAGLSAGKLELATG